MKRFSNLWATLADLLKLFSHDPPDIKLRALRTITLLAVTVTALLVTGSVLSIFRVTAWLWH